MPILSIHERKEVIQRTEARVFDKSNGKQIWEMLLPAYINGGPMTYRVGRKQYIVVAVGGGNEPAELLALSLP